MKIDFKGALKNLNECWEHFRHRGKPMTKLEVKLMLLYGIQKGYKNTSEFTDEEVDNILKKKK